MMQQETIKTGIQIATFAIVALTALAGFGLFAIDARTEVLKEKVATLEQQQAAIVKVQEDIADLRERMARMEGQFKQFGASLDTILERLPASQNPPPPRPDRGG